MVNPQAKISADITLFTSMNTETASHAISEKSGFVIDGPGEYEVKDVFIKGFLSEAKHSSTGLKLVNTIYMITFEGMKLCFLGALSNPELHTDLREMLEDVDILFVPIGGDSVLDPAVAYKLAVSIAPSVIIPMYYSKQTLEHFLKEGGQKIEAIDKLVVKKKDLEGKEGEIILLKEE